MLNKRLFRFFLALAAVATLLWMLRLETPPPASYSEPELEHVEPTPIAVTLAAPSPRPAAQNEQLASPEASGAMRIDAAHSDPAQTLPWLMSRGGRILLVRGDRIVAEMDADFQLRPAESVPENADLRLITGEIVRATGRPLPNGAEYALLVWPSNLWAELMRALEHSPDSRHELVYTLSGGAMEIRDRREPQTIIVRFE